MHQPTGPDSPLTQMRYYLSVIHKRRYLALAVGLIVLTACAVAGFLLPKTYEANSVVFIERSSLIEPLIKGVGVSAGVEERLKNLKESVTTRNIIDRVAKKLDLDSAISNQTRYEQFIDGVRKNLTITVKGSRGREDANLFVISYRGGKPEVVRDFVNTLVNEYIEESLGFQKSDAYNAYEFIQGQLAEYKKKLDESDAAIREFRERHPNTVPQTETTVLARMEGFQTAGIETEIRLKELLRKKESLKKQLSGEKELTVAFVSRDGSPQGRLQYLNSQLMSLVTKYTEHHPEVIRVRGEIEELKRQISQARESIVDGQGSEMAAMNPVYQQIKEELVRTENEIESLRARSSELNRQQQLAQGTLSRMPKEQEAWMKQIRDRNVYQKIYDDLLQKLENARVSKDLEVTNKTSTFRVVDPAIRPSTPVSPDRVQMILIGIALGIGAGVAAALGIELLGNAFRDEGAIVQALGIPVLASIPRITSEAAAARIRIRDRKIFGAAAAYVMFILVVLAAEVVTRRFGVRIIPF